MFEQRSKSLDVGLSIILTLVYFIIYFIVFNKINAFNYLNNANVISLFVSIFVALLGVIAVIMTLFTVFDDAFKNNRAIKVLKQSNTEIQLYERYSDSLILIFGSVVILSILFIATTGNYLSHGNEYVLTFILGIGFSLIVLCFIRTYRCFILFSLLKRAIHNATKN